MGIAALLSKLHWHVAMGALFFVASDSILALSIFREPLPLSNYLVMATYYIAQYFIVFGLVQSKNKL